MPEKDLPKPAAVAHYLCPPRFRINRAKDVQVKIFSSTFDPYKRSPNPNSLPEFLFKNASLLLYTEVNSSNVNGVLFTQGKTPKGPTSACSLSAYTSFASTTVFVAPSNLSS